MFLHVVNLYVIPIHGTVASTASFVLLIKQDCALEFAVESFRILWFERLEVFEHPFEIEGMADSNGLTAIRIDPSPLSVSGPKLVVFSFLVASLPNRKSLQELVECGWEAFRPFRRIIVHQGVNK
jgi:hypothetical protein